MIPLENMLKLFKNFIEANRLFTKNQKILLAISGGIDSVVMLDLFAKAGYNCGIAHCNFHLRNEESDMDEEFVRKLAGKYNISFYKHDFDTETYAKRKHISIQMAARDLRYNWFERQRKRQNFDFIALAHHADDIVETFHINIARGTGIRGLTGIKAKNNKLVRPLLFATRQQITEYCTATDLQYREDSSNHLTKYARNKIRHIVIPAMEEISPNYGRIVIENIERFREVEQIYRSAIENEKRKCLIESGDEKYIKINELKKLTPIKTYLYEFINEFNFTHDTICEIINALNSSSGKQFYSTTHRLIKDRENLIITPIRKYRSVNL